MSGEMYGPPMPEESEYNPALRRIIIGLGLAAAAEVASFWAGSLYLTEWRDMAFVRQVQAGTFNRPITVGGLVFEPPYKGDSADNLETALRAEANAARADFPFAATTTLIGVAVSGSWIIGGAGGLVRTRRRAGHRGRA